MDKCLDYYQLTIFDGEVDVDYADPYQLKTDMMIESRLKDRTLFKNVKDAENLAYRLNQIIKKD